MTKVFYSWQSDLPNKTNRGLILDALESAAKSIREDNSIEIEPVIDRDTAGEPGSPDISNTIFAKIEQARIFVADVSIINSGTTNTRLTPNPNVLIELGFAIKALGQRRIILVFNSSYGSPEQLPFDLRMKRVLAYSLHENSTERATERKNLSRKFEEALRTILADFSTLLSDVDSKDNLLFKLLCENVVKSERNSFGKDTILELIKHFDNKEDLYDSLRILERKGYIQGEWTLNGEVHSVIIHSKGFETYAKLYVNNYSVVKNDVIRTLVKSSEKNSSYIAKYTNQPHFLVKHILLILEDNNLLEISGGKSFSYHNVWATNISPELKRLV